MHWSVRARVHVFGVVAVAGCSGGDSKPPSHDSAPPVYDLTGVVECPPEGGYPRLDVADARVKRYCLTLDHASGYRDNEGNDPAFNVVSSTSWTGEGPRPVLVFLHGGVMGVDDDPSKDRFCQYWNEETQAGTRTLIESAITEKGTIVQLAIDAGWLYVVPESNWCDLWSGMGEQDPVDPNHKSLLHVETVLDVLSAGLDGYDVDDARIYAWGTSIGALGGWVLSDGYVDAPHTIAGVIADSGPFATADWYAYGSNFYRELLDHVLGGDPFEPDGTTPSAFHANYARLDSALLMRDHGVRTPIFVAYNSFDGIVEPIHGPYVTAALDDVYAASGARYFVRDWKHHAPMGAGGNFHTQTPNSGIPWAYGTVAAFDFLRGKQVRYVEAETMCDAGACTMVNEDDPAWCTDPSAPEVCYGTANTVARMMDGTAAERRAADGAGNMFVGTLPADLPRGVPLVIRPVMHVSGFERVAGSIVVAELTLTRDGAPLTTVTLRASDFGGGSPRASLSQVSQTSLATDFDGDGAQEGLPDGTIGMTLTTAGVGDVLFDGVWVAWREQERDAGAAR